jgi:hypothetical protein
LRDADGQHIARLRRGGKAQGQQRRDEGAHHPLAAL